MSQLSVAWAERVPDEEAYTPGGRPNYFRVTFDIRIDRDEWLNAHNKPDYIASKVAEETVKALKKRGDIW